MKILWLDINASYSHSSLALPSLHSQVEESLRGQFDWCVVSGTINREPSISLIEVINKNPQVIFSTLWLFNHNYLTNLLSKVKKLIPSVTIILGGPEFLGDNQRFLRQNNFVKAVFRGEGEEVFSQILNTFTGIGKLAGIRGICMVDEKGLYIDNGIATVSSFSLLNPPEESTFFDWDKPFVQIETSRGCFNRCSFCVSGNARKVEEIPYEKLRYRLDVIKEKGIKEIRVLDRTFNANALHATSLLNVFSDYHPDISFHLEIHPAFLNDQLKRVIEELPEGLLFLEAGVQSLRDNVLTACNRAGNSENTVSGLKYLCSLKKFTIHADLIAGLPGYSFRSIVEDLRFLSTLDVDEIQLEKLKLLPGTIMRERAAIMNIIYSNTPPYEVLQTPSISAEELYDTALLSKITDMWFNDSTWHKPFREAIMKETKFLEEMLIYCKESGVLSSPLSREKRGIILYSFCKEHYPEICPKVEQAWESAGLSVYKGAGRFSKKYPN